MQTSRNSNAKRLKLIVLLLANKATENVAAREKIIQLLGGRATLSQDLPEASELLDSVALVLAQLLRGLNIVLSVLVWQTLGGLLNLSHQLIELLRRDILSNNLVQNGDGACQAVKTATDGTVGTSLLVDELDKGLLGASAGVRLSLGRALREELDGRESGNTLFLAQGTGVLSFSVDLGDNNVGLEGEVVGEGFPGRSEGLAV